MRRLEQKDRIQAVMVLPIDRLVVQGLHVVRRLTRNFTSRHERIIRRIDRSSYSGDGYDNADTQPVMRELTTITPLEMPLLNGQQAFPEDRLRLVHSEPFKLAIEDLIPSSVVEELYDAQYFIARGLASTGVRSVDFSDKLRRIAGPGLERWREIDGLLKLIPGDQNPSLVVEAEKIADSIERTTGFRLEDLEERRLMFATRLSGSKLQKGPISIILVG